MTFNVTYMNHVRKGYYCLGAEGGVGFGAGSIVILTRK